MPLYQQLILALPNFSAENLAISFRKHADIILKAGGVVRSVEHHGIRPLQERAKRKFATIDGIRYFWEARYITATFDINPKGLVEVERYLKNEDAILRYYTMKVGSAVNKVNTRTFRNPYLGLKPFKPLNI